MSTLLGRLLLVATGAAAASVGTAASVLPNGWALRATSDPVVQTGTMPQGAAISSDGSTLAILESGFNPPALALYATPSLRLLKRVSLTGAFGRPVWTDSGILVAGANADALFVVDPKTHNVRKIALPKNSYPIAVAARNGTVAVATDGDGAVRMGSLDALPQAPAVRVGPQLGKLAFSSDGTKLFVTVRSSSYVAEVDTRTKSVRRIPTDLHPSDVLVVGGRLYVAQADADAVGEYDAQSGMRLADTFVGTMPHTIGSSPNALAAQGGAVFVSLGAANEIAVLSNGRVSARLPAGWYPTDAIPSGDRLYVIDGKGEGTKANPDFNVMSRGYHDYIAAIQFGSIRELTLGGAGASPNPQGAINAGAAPSQTVVRQGGPIRHVFFILKENRTYDQILGDMSEGNGDAKLVYFGARVTPNQHALAQRFGLFDDFYASGEVSDAGHNWADGAFVNDYAERMWPPAYGNRNDNDQVLTGIGASVPAHGYMWDAARRAGVTFRDYGEMALMPAIDGHPASTAPSIGNRYDTHYVGWNLDYSDINRYKEWKREFDRFLANNSVPQLEYMWLPNDHTAGTRAGTLTPAAYIASNDYAVGLIVAAISHSKIWPSSAIFITEDDAQDGADHVSDQRTTFYIASPYAKGGLEHEHYSTVSVLRTMEVLLGMQPLSNYDATALPLYAAFRATPNLAPFVAISPKVSLTTRNSKVAYRAALAARLDFSRPDAVSPGIMTDMLEHAGYKAAATR
ncbi:MAG: alkaline phosphatase family protein [Candidatus Cybelea sp.]